MARPAPDDYAEIAPTMTQTELIKHYGTYSEQIRRWREETGIQELTGNQPKPMPEGFAEDAFKLTRKQLIAKYGISENIVQKWKHRLITGQTGGYKRKEAVCAICGKKFAAIGNGKYCSQACKDEADRRGRQRNRQQQHHEKQPTTLAEIAKAANEAGMTYGQYVMMMKNQ